MNSNSLRKSLPGKWPKGISGNPTGRPRGSRNKSTLAMEALLEEGAEQLINKAMKMALNGDTGAMRLCLERLLPARRDRLVHLDLPPIGSAKDMPAVISSVVASIADGQLTPAEGEMMANILTAQTNVLMAEELEDRLQKVEAQLKPGEPKE